MSAWFALETLVTIEFEQWRRKAAMRVAAADSQNHHEGRLWAARESDPQYSDFNGLCYCKCILKFNTEIPNSTVHLRVPE